MRLSVRVLPQVPAVNCMLGQLWKDWQCSERCTDDCTWIGEAMSNNDHPYQGTIYLLFIDKGYHAIGPTVQIYQDRAQAIEARDKELETYRKVWVVSYQRSEAL